MSASVGVKINEIVNEVQLKELSPVVGMYSLSFSACSKNVIFA